MTDFDKTLIDFTAQRTGLNCTARQAFLLAFDIAYTEDIIEMDGSWTPWDDDEVQRSALAKALTESAIMEFLYLVRTGQLQDAMKMTGGVSIHVSERANTKKISVNIHGASAYAWLVANGGVDESGWYGRERSADWRGGDVTVTAIEVAS